MDAIRFCPMLPLLLGALASVATGDSVCDVGPTILSSAQGTMQAVDKMGFGDRNCTWLIDPSLESSSRTRIQLSWKALELVNDKDKPFPPGYQPGPDGAFLGDCPLASIELYAMRNVTADQSTPLRGMQGRVASNNGDIIMRVCGELADLDARIMDIGVIAPAVKVVLRSTAQAALAVDFALDWSATTMDPVPSQDPQPSADPSPPPDVPGSCKLSAWSDWGECNAGCGMGKKIRTRAVLQHGEPGAPACGTLVEEEDCLVRPCNSLDEDRSCSFLDWNPWGNCTLSCGTGTRLQTRDLVEPRLGAGTCGSMYRTSDCNMNPCEEPSPCEATKVIEGEASGVVQIGHPSSEPGGSGSVPVPPSSTCEWKIIGSSSQDIKLVWDWVEMPVVFNGSCNLLTTGEVEALAGSYNGNLDEIDARCAVAPLPQLPTLPGRTVRTSDATELVLRLITPSTEGAWGFKASFELVSRVQPSHAPEPPVNCTLGNWTQWSECSAECGQGVQTRSRPIVAPARHGGSCPGPLDETRPCDAGPCGHNSTDTDCVVGPWGNFSSCSRECGSGIQTRIRHVLVP